MNIAALLQQGDRAAFHGRPLDGLPALQTVLDDPDATADQRAQARWLQGVCLAAAGRFAAASATLSALTTHPNAHDRQLLELAGAAACVQGSIHRQLGLFQEAAEFDQWATTVTAADTLVHFEAQLGLAADAVGQGDRSQARAKLEWARQHYPHESRAWRERIRFGWVAAETELLHEDALAAKQVITKSVAEAEDMGAPRHVAKSLLFQAVTMHILGEEGDLVMMARAALLAESLGAVPLVWVARSVLSQWLLPVDQQAAYAARLAAAQAARTIGTELPSTLAEQWWRRHDVAPLFA